MTVCGRYTLKDEFSLFLTRTASSHVQFHVRIKAN
jgi:hypothetical protein